VSVNRRVKSFDEVKDDLIALEKQKLVDEARTRWFWRCAPTRKPFFT
jgi:hypothetical protein